MKQTKHSSILHPRSLAVLICESVIYEGQSLGEAIDDKLENKDISPQDRGFIQSLSFGVTRWYWQLNDQLKPLLQKPIKAKERQVKLILLVGIYQIQHLQTPAHAAVSDTVKCCQKLNKTWAKNLINACLRNYLRKQDEREQITLPPTHYSHPEWMIERIEQAWPEQKKLIFAANNQAAPLCLRVNKRYCSPESYLELLHEHDIEASLDPYSGIGIRVKNSIAIHRLPKFSAGWVSVQDTASQLIHQFFQIKNNDRVLDACAAPGGKTSLLLEHAPEDIVMHAVDIKGKRNNKLVDTLKRLNLTAKIITGDASEPTTWWDKEFYQHILVDAPCSGLGVVRRHPDIKHLRQENDLVELKQSQRNILTACWELLADNGKLLYTTCSILPEENEQQINDFLQKNPEAKSIHIDHPTAVNLKFGQQTLPGISDMDGFYYCLLQKVVK